MRTRAMDARTVAEAMAHSFNGIGRLRGRRGVAQRGG
jgi:hypothetical protein